ncbi:MAG TPA: hypothetical protein PLL75_04405 [Candidatus Omnitrophota bacterium]|nr:hypothetical protein [Candidatus Omnitrophota bacterium]HPS36952.1 hypothetical protein [Candidatus Omnitrophota bacterium]
MKRIIMISLGILFLGTSTGLALEPQHSSNNADAPQQPTVSIDELSLPSSNTSGGSVTIGQTGGFNEGTVTGGGTIITDQGSTQIGGVIGPVIIAYNRDLSAGTLLRDTVMQSLKGMISSFLNNGSKKQNQMAATVQKMVNFLDASITTLGPLNSSGVEITIEKEKNGRQTNTLTVLNRDGNIATLTIVYPAAGNTPASVSYSAESIFRKHGNVSAQSIRNYVRLYGNPEGQAALEGYLRNLKKGGKISGFFYYWAPVPEASYMEFTSIEHKRDGRDIQRTLRVWGDGNVNCSEVIIHSAPLPLSGNASFGTISGTISR